MKYKGLTIGIPKEILTESVVRPPHQKLQLVLFRKGHVY